MRGGCVRGSAGEPAEAVEGDEEGGIEDGGI